MNQSTKAILLLGAGLFVFDRMNNQPKKTFPNGGIPTPPTMQPPLPSKLNEVYSVAGYDNAVVFSYEYSSGNPPQYSTTYVIGDKQGQGFLSDSSNSYIMVNGKKATAFSYDNAVNRLNKMATPSTSPTDPMTPEPPEFTPPPSHLKPDYGFGSGQSPLAGW